MHLEMTDIEYVEERNLRIRLSPLTTVPAGGSHLSRFSRSMRLAYMDVGQGREQDAEASQTQQHPMLVQECSDRIEGMGVRPEPP